MTYDESAVASTIDGLLAEHAELDVTVAGTLDNLDQYHTGGAAAVERIIPALDAGPGRLVLDVGSGLGGPARQIARRTGAHVIGIDITAEYVDAARHLSAMAGLADVTQFEVADLASFAPPRRFDAAVTMHVQMNLADKSEWFAHIHDVLSDGGRLAVWEICADADATLNWPLPWSLDGSDSYLASSAELHASIETAGFTGTEWIDETGWVREWLTQTFAAGPPVGPTLPTLLDDGLARVVNLAGALAGGTVSVWRGAFTKQER